MDGLAVSTKRYYVNVFNDFNAYVEDNSDENKVITDHITDYGINLHGNEDMKSTTIWSHISPLKTVCSLLKIDI